MAMLDRISSPFTRQEYGIPAAPVREAPVREVRPVDLDATQPIIRRLPTPVQILPMRCLSCQGTVERSTTCVKLERSGCRLEWEAVPAWICTRCGKPYFEPSEVERIQLATKALAALAK